MAKKKVVNTSKTAHVMNLISKSYDTPPETPEETAAPADTAISSRPQAQAPAAPAAPQPPAAPAPQPSAVPILNADLEITSQIKSALEDLVEDLPDSEPPKAPPAAPQEAVPEPAPEPAPEPSQESPEPAPEPVSEKVAAPVPEPVPEKVTAPVPEPVSEKVTAPVPEPVSEKATAPVSEPSQKTSAPAEPAPEPPKEIQEAAPDPEQLVRINIMEALVEQAADRYISMFGLCTCPRCVADVKAIALNGLVPHYLVAPERERSFRVTIYQERYHAEVTAQILQACKTVLDHPRHPEE